MNLQLKSLACLICLLWGISSSSATNIHERNDCGQPCNEPAPTNYNITDILTNAIYVAWDVPPNMPFEYNIKVFETSSGNLVQSYNIPGNVAFARAGNLQPGTEYTIRTTPVCPDGTLSSNSVELPSRTLIVELVVSGFTISGSSNCSFNAVNQYCNADPYVGNTTIFRVRQTVSPFASRYFGLYRVSEECNHNTFKVRPEDSGSNLKFYSVYQDNPQCPGEMLMIKNGETVVARLGVQDPASTLKFIYCISMAQNYLIERFGTATGVLDENAVDCGCPPQGRSSSFEGLENDSWAGLSAAPNPFTNQLDIQIPFANINENTELNLYDLQGRRVMTLRSPGDQQTITLNTEKCSPGMYFLRAESGGIVQTVKVVKTQ